MVKTKYSLMSGIDDFVLVGSIDKCKDFLNNNKEYISCHGRYYMHKSASEINNRRCLVHDISVGSYSISQNKIFKRSIDYLTNYNAASTNFYAVFRTIQLKLIFNILCLHLKKFNKSPTITFEIMFCLLCHILGKTKHLNILYSTKEKHFSIPNINSSLVDEKELLEDYVDFVIKKSNLNINLNYKEINKINYFLSKKFNKITNHHSQKKKNIFISLLKTFKIYHFLKELYLNFLKIKKMI